MPYTPGAHPGVLHHYSARLVAFEHVPTSQAPAQNTVLFIAGLSDGLLTVPYSTALVEKLPPGWSVTQILISASYIGWGTSSLDKDAEEIGRCVEYLKKLRPEGKVVLMGHSTGCQDTMRYVTGKDAHARPRVDGAILQASGSDREALELVFPKDVADNIIARAQQMVKDGKEEDILPSGVTAGFFEAPVTARRWLSLASPNHDGDDDYFSSDLSDEQLRSSFGKFGATPVCILFSGSDEWIPSFVDKEALVKRWEEFVRQGGGVVDEKHSGVVAGASHNLSNDTAEVVDRLVQRIAGFIGRLDGGELKAPGSAT